MATTDLAPYIRTIWRYKWFICAIVILALLASYYLNSRQLPTYTATALIKVGRIWNEPLEDAYVLSEVINSQPFLARVGEKLKEKRAAEDLIGALTAEQLEGGRARNRYVYLIRLTARSRTATEAYELASVATAAVIEKTGKTFDRLYPTYSAREEALTTKINNLRTTMASAKANKDYNQFEIEQTELEKLEREVFEVKLNNQSPLKTYRTSLVEEISSPQLLPHADSSKRMAITGIVAFTFTILGVLVWDWAEQLLKSTK